MHQAKPILSLLGMVAWGDLGGTSIYKTHRGKVVQFAKTYPKSWPTFAQAALRSRFAWANELWNNLLPDWKQYWVDVTKHYSLCMCGHALYIATWMKDDRGILQQFEHATGLPIWHEQHSYIREDMEPWDRWGDHIRQGNKFTHAYQAPFDIYICPNYDLKCWFIYWDTTLPYGAPLPITTVVTGPGTVGPVVAKNLQYACWYFTSPNVTGHDLYNTTVDHHYVDAAGKPHYFIYTFHTIDDISFT